MLQSLFETIQGNKFTGFLCTTCWRCLLSLAEMCLLSSRVMMSQDVEGQEHSSPQDTRHDCRKGIRVSLNAPRLISQREECSCIHMIAETIAHNCPSMCDDNLNHHSVMFDCIRAVWIFIRWGWSHCPTGITTHDSQQYKSVMDYISNQKSDKRVALQYILIVKV